MSMVKIDNRESAHVRSRVKDLSKVPNVVSYTGLFACITPLAKVAAKQNDEGRDVYDPILIRDTDSLIANFGDPRVDPEKYIDLYTVMQIVGNGTSCYVAKVASGKQGIYDLNFAGITTAEITGSGTTYSATSTFVSPDVFGLSKIDSDGNITVLNKVDDAFSTDTATATKEFKVTVDGTAITITLDCALAENEHLTQLKIQPTDNEAMGIRGYSSMTDPLDIQAKITQAKPESIQAYYLNVSVKNNNSGSAIASVRVKLEDTTTNQGLVNTINSALGSYIQFELKDPTYKDACSITSDREYSIVYNLLEANAPKDSDTKKRKPLIDESAPLPDAVEVSAASFEVTIDNYIDAQKQFNDHKYAGCIMSDLTSPVNTTSEKLDAKAKYDQYVVNKASYDEYLKNALAYWYYKHDDATTHQSSYNAWQEASFSDDTKPTGLPEGVTEDVPLLETELDAPDTAPSPVTKPSDVAEVTISATVRELLGEERRTLHYHLKEIARQRKDINVLLSTPLYNDAADGSKSLTAMTMDEVCNWVSSDNVFNNLYQYGSTNTVDYGEQSFYLEMYYSWLEMTCTHLENGVAKSKQVKVAPAGPVANNVLTSYRERGIHLPVAGDQGGELSSIYTVINNPKTKAERDQLVSYRINPIWDTGTRGVQIYGNETLNAGYTDLNAAHIARALVNIRSRVDEYTETLKFSLNNAMLWDKWKNYVSMYILEPFKNAGALAKYSVAMGLDTTTPEEIANRMIKGKVSLTFYQSAEIFDLEFTVFSSATAFE